MEYKVLLRGSYVIGAAPPLRVDLHTVLIYGVVYYMLGRLSLGLVALFQLFALTAYGPRNAFSLLASGTQLHREAVTVNL